MSNPLFCRERFEDGVLEGGRAEQTEVVRKMRSRSTKNVAVLGYDYINVYVSYEYWTRGIFYGARMISVQVNREFVPPHYEDIKKVYSIWICMNVPKKLGNSLTVYQMKKHNLIGEMPSERENYDKLSVVVICLNEKVKDNQTGLHRLLNVLLSPCMPVEEKASILEIEFKIPMTQELQEEMSQMCNLSEAIEEKGIRKGKRIGKQEGKKEGMEIARVEAVENLMRNLNLTLEKALEALNISRKEYENSRKNMSTRNQ